jgi:hypothetical protein
MNKVLTPKSIAQESGKAIIDTLENACVIALAMTAMIIRVLLVGGFLTLPVLIAKYLEVVPEFTGYSLFQNWLSTTTFLWASFWVAAFYNLCNRLEKLKVKKEKEKEKEKA